MLADPLSRPIIGLSVLAIHVFRCEDRKDNGYNSGMGEIFRKVAAISPVPVRALGMVEDGAAPGPTDDVPHEEL